MGLADVYAPDLWWTSEQHRPPAGANALPGLPDLIVEVHSPSTWRYDIGIKRATYESAGVAELWLVDTDSASVLVYRRSSPQAPRFDQALELAGDESLQSPLLLGFGLAVASLFT